MASVLVALAQPSVPLWGAEVLAPDALRNMGHDAAAVEAYGELERYDDELEPVRVVFHLDTAEPEALYRLGILYEEMGAYRSAIEMFRRVLTIRPSDGRAQRNIGFVLLEQAKPEDAIEPFEAAIEIDPTDWKAHAGLSAAYTQASRSVGAAALATQSTIDYRARATEEARESVRLNPGDHRPWYRLGMSLRDDQTTLPEAIEAFTRAAAIRPDDPVVLRVLTIAKRRAGRSPDFFRP
jgi:tetratricopeptide (TPR) repeat protein